MQYWEFKTDAIATLLALKGYIVVDQLRVGVENLAGHTEMNYYERWVLSLIQILINTKIITRKELEKTLNINQELYNNNLQNNDNGDQANNSNISQKTDNLEQQEQHYQKGDVIRIKPEDSNIPFRRPHLRTPGYVYGAQGIIVRFNGMFGNPELLAFGEEGPKQQLYTVRFRQKDLWKEYQGGINDTVEMEVFQHWLENPQHQQNNSELKNNLQTNFNNIKIQEDVITEQQQQNHQSHDHDHDHNHLDRHIVEQNAVLKEGQPQPGEQISHGLAQLLIEKGIFDKAELQQAISKAENFGKNNEGARIVARAWLNPQFKQKLLQDANSAVNEELNIQASNAHTSTKLVVVENTDNLHHVVVCTLCSCYPRAILGMSPSWYKSRAYRSRVVREPLEVLNEFGVQLDKNTEIRVVDSTADIRYMVLPNRPKNSEGWSEQQLIEAVNRDSMIGVAVL